MTSGSAGVLFYNNTILTETSAGSSANTHWRYNLILGENSAPAISSVSTHTNYSSSDHNGFRPNGAESFQWNSPSTGVAASFADRDVTPKLESRSFDTLEAYAQATKQDQHSGRVDYDVFVNAPPLNATDRATVQRVYTAQDADFRLKPGSAAIDRGVVLQTSRMASSVRGQTWEQFSPARSELIAPWPRARLSSRRRPVDA